MTKSLKIESIKFSNHVHFKTLKCEFDGTMTEIIGLNGSGKTTFINALWMAIKGIALKGSDCIIGDRFKFIQSGKKSMDVEIALIDENHDNARIIINRHILKDSSKLTFQAPENYPISHEWLQNLLSVSFLSAKNFTQKNKREQALLLGIDTSEYDTRITELKNLYTLLNRQCKTLGEPIPVDKVVQVDIRELLKKKKEIQVELDKKVDAAKAHNNALRVALEGKRKLLLTQCINFNEAQDKLVSRVYEIKSAYGILRDNGYKGNELSEWIDSLPNPQPHKNWDVLVKEIKEPDYLTEKPDISEIVEIDNQIAEASETNAKASQYKNYLQTIADIELKKGELKENQERQQALQVERTEYIKSYQLDFAGLEIDDDGGLILNGREIREPYFSKGELEKIVAMLRASLKDELKVVFIDDFDLLDEQNQKAVPEYLINKGFQVIVAKVGRSTGGKNIISLSEPVDESELKPKLI